MIDIEKERERTGYSGKPQQWQFGFDLAMSIAQKAESEKCVWRETEDGIWGTECGRDYVFDSYAAQKPSDSGQYCSNCGKKIEDVPFEDIEHE
ncbi:hypothetical protein SAMN05421749_103279 [Acinetobacter marinus]|uniref:Uncharacterized protein n=1 Tax=Acinetobacter marinus TaxID=281375 RepID=A0A1G6J8S6_9GAMM|nr:hypothetical protein [Acinetobacter marinus]SDC15214.1 hypothetical protein SAMN05421749_103279 [Acinetobacter marinus]